MGAVLAGGLKTMASSSIRQQEQTINIVNDYTEKSIVKPSILNRFEEEAILEGAADLLISLFTNRSAAQ